MSNLIAISGKIGSGKDELSQMIQYIAINNSIDDSDWHWSDNYQLFRKEANVNFFSKHNKWEVKRFADKIKDIVCLLIGCTREELEDREFKEKPLGEEWDKWRVYWEVAHKPRNHGHFSSRKEAVDYAKMLGATDRDIKEMDVVVRKQMTPRKLMQLLGTDCGREIIHPSIWVNALMADYVADKSNWIIPDTRFPNEIERVDKYNGIKIRVHRYLTLRFPEIWREYGYAKDLKPSTENDKMLLSYMSREYPELHEKLTHASETALDDYDGWDYVVYNNYSLQKLYEIAQEIVEEENL